MKRKIQQAKDSIPTKKQKTEMQIQKDILPNIFNFLEDSSLFHSACLVSKEWSNQCNNLYFWKSRTLNQWPSLKLMENMKEKPWNIDEKKSTEKTNLSKDEVERQFWRNFYIDKKKPKNKVYETVNKISQLMERNTEMEYEQFIRKLYRLFQNGISIIESWANMQNYKTFVPPNDQFQFLTDSIVYTNANYSTERDIEWTLTNIQTNGRFITLKGNLISFKFKHDWSYHVTARWYYIEFL